MPLVEPISFKLVEALPVGPLLGKTKNRVKRLGVELEGAWKELPPGTDLEHDGSVFRNNHPAGFHLVGELPIGPIQPAAMPGFMKKYYPHKVDKTCGMHVHMSFANLLQYAWLEVPEYQETIIEQISLWATAEGFDPKHHIWERLSGKCIFCQKVFDPDGQIASKKKDHNQERPGHRYTIVHFCGRQNTVEIRVLPMMDTVAQGIRAAQLVVDVTNASLAVLAQRHGKVSGRVELPNGEIYEETIEEEVPLTSAQRRRLLNTL